MSISYEAQLVILGWTLGMVSSLITAVAVYFLNRRRDDINYKRQLEREKLRLEREMQQEAERRLMDRSYVGKAK